MSTEYIIERFGRKVGLNPGDDNQRYVILDLPQNFLFQIEILD